MNQKQIQEKSKTSALLDKAQVIAASNKVRRTSNRKIWIVGSSDPHYLGRFYRVLFEEEELDAFTCDCLAYVFEGDSRNPCKHILSVAIFEGSND